MATRTRGDVQSVFQKYDAKNYPFHYLGTLRVHNIFGGIPTDLKVGENFIKSKLQGSEELIREAVLLVMYDRGVSEDEAAKIVDQNKHLNGFKRDRVTGELYIEPRQLKAGLKEAVGVAANASKLPAKGWGATNKGLIGWFPEHAFVVGDRIGLGVKEPTGINQDFVHTWRGTGIQYNEFIEECDIDFEIETDIELSEEQWASIFLTGQRQGIGASRSQGRGQYVVTRWERKPV